MQQLVKEWAAGRTTLKDIKGYDSDELYSIAHVAYYMLMQGKNDEAKVIFEGLTAIDPRNDYYHRALGLLYYKMGESERAVKQFSYALRVDSKKAVSYVNRAEVYIAMKKMSDAAQDLAQAAKLVTSNNPALKKKIAALMRAVGSKI